ncbi:DNA/RNA-binding protein KIN17 [Gryllus bimaculatus]|nr:DNA/RNA-binding protein KIN17 [Gryllus bimaculatus]
MSASLVRKSLEICDSSADNASKYIDSFSREFEEGYLELLSRQFGTKRVHANRVYQDYISERHHLHMNATQWETLTEFVKWLGREGKCVVDETEKGWFVQYIDRNPETIALQEAKAKKEKMEKDDEERRMEFFEKQVEMGKKNAKDETPVFTELVKDGDEKIVVNLNLNSIKKEVKPESSGINALKKKLKEEKEKNANGEERKKKDKGEKRKASALDDIIKEEESKKEKVNRKDYWLVEGIVVKVMAKSLGDKYYKKKGVVKEVPSKYVAMVTMLDTGHKLKLDQAHLETVIPAVGRQVMVVNGAYRGSVAVLKSLDEDKFCVSIEISSGPLKGRVVDNVQYEDIRSLRKNGDKHLRKLQKLSRKDRSSTRVKSVAEAVKRMRSEGDKTEENIRKLELLGSLDIDSAIAKKIINRAVKSKEEEVKIEEPQGTVFTEEDFEKFEKEYFVNA